MAQTSMETWWQTSQLGAQASAYIEALYDSYQQDPDQVPESWRQYFAQMEQDAASESMSHSQVQAAFKALAKLPSHGSSAGVASQTEYKYAKVMRLINAYRGYGHLEAKLDPLGLWRRASEPQLSLSHKGLSAADLKDHYSIPGFFGGKSFTLQQIVNELQRIYCQSIGFEYMHIGDEHERHWLREQIEVPSSHAQLTEQKQKWLLQRLVAADGLEKYLGQRYVGQKRFSLEGGDSLIPMLDYFMQTACEENIKEAVIGMAHRGRLNVLANVMGKSPESLFAEFEGKHRHDLLSGDVKYHNGYSSDIETTTGMLHMALAFNPSHLEIVGPVVEGSVRARQDRRKDCDGDQVFAVQIHGDAAFSGQGVVMETLNMSRCPGFATHGSVHVVINNQVGFTMSKIEDARSTRYCTDVAKMLEAPIFHVNAEDPEAVLRVAKIAMDYRQRYRKDVFIDLVCYRRHGHNEADEPAATQPVMYQTIKQMQVPAKRYAHKLTEDGVITDGYYHQVCQEYKEALKLGRPVANTISAERNRKYIANWAPYQNTPWDIGTSTKIDKSNLIAIAQRLDSIPEAIVLQKQVERTIKERQQMTLEKVAVNWGYAEVLAYGSLLEQGYPVRLCGEDSGRGTFAHRHCELHDQQSGDIYVPLNHISSDQAHFTVVNSLLSEEAVMAFEYGYSSSDTDTLVLWEAQFGDFANGAQVVIDQFMSAAEEKWGRLAGLVLLLPHGQEGMGAEHSSARLERFLQLCANDNMQVCVPTTPAQLFHMLRRQVIRPYRKPLIVMTPKSLLRHRLVTSTMADLAEGQFNNVLAETDNLDPAQVKRIVLCQGKVYYDLLAQRRDAGIEDVAIVRLEQLYPFPLADLKQVLAPYQHVTDVIWCQEEPENQGAWYVIERWLRQALTANQNINYIGRPAFAAPAVGYPEVFKKSQQALVNAALTQNQD